MMSVVLTVGFGLVFSILILMALFGNILVCVAILWDRRLRKQSENLFLLSLACSDIAISMLVMSFAAVNDLSGHWMFGQVYCKLWISFDITCCTASILNLCAISLDRYWHISNPMHYIRIMNHRRTMIVILIIWIVSAVLGSGQIFFGLFGDSKQNSTLSRNGSHWAPKRDLLNKDNVSTEQCLLDLSVEYAIVSSTLSFFLPAAVMFGLYTKLYLYARSHARSIRSQLRAVTGVLLFKLTWENREKHDCVSHCDCELLKASMNENNSPQVDRSTMRRWSTPPVHASIAQKARTGNVTNDMQQARQLLAEQKQTKNTDQGNEASDHKARVTLGVIMGVFLLCWLPFFCSNIVAAFWQDFPRLLYMIFTWFGYANSSANPIIYSIFNRDFRRAFGKILLNVCEFCTCCTATCVDKLRNKPSTPGRSMRRRGFSNRRRSGRLSNKGAAANNGLLQKTPSLKNGKTRLSAVVLAGGEEDESASLPLHRSDQSPSMYGSSSIRAPPPSSIGPMTSGRSTPEGTTTLVLANPHGASVVVSHSANSSPKAKSDSVSLENTAAVHRYNEKPVEMIANV